MQNTNNPPQPPVIEFGSHVIYETRGPSLALAQCVAAFDRTLGSSQAGEWKFNDQWLEETIPASEVHPSLSCQPDPEDEELVEEYKAYMASLAKRANNQR